MELSELRDKLLSIFEVDSVDAVPSAMMQTVMHRNNRLFHDVKEILPDLSCDWLRKVFQYYMADRDEKKQDFTPDSLAVLMARLAGDTDTIVDLCAGSGALTIAAWNVNPGLKFECYELDKRVLPFLLFNLAIRNINATVHHGDVLREIEFATYTIISDEEFSRVEVAAHGNDSVYQQSAVQYTMEKNTNSRQ